MSTKYYALLKEMFTQMVEKKNASLIPHYFHTEFLLYSNGKIMDYQDTVDYHEEVYKTPVQYQVDFEEGTVLESGEKVAARLMITTSKPGEDTIPLEIILIAEYKDDKIHRVWELTYPDWSQLERFE